MSSSEDEIEEELRKGFGRNSFHGKKRRRRDIDGKEFGMLGDFAEEGTSSSSLRYMPVTFASSETKPDAPLFKKEGTPLFKKAGDSQDEKKPESFTGSMNNPAKQFMNLRSKYTMNFAKPKEEADEEMEDARPSFGNMNSVMNGFTGLGAPKLNDETTTRNSWSMMGNTESQPESPSMATPPSFNTANKFNTHGSNKASSKNVSTYGIGAKLLQKMGYVSGKGLGADGKGIINPVEHKLRPQGLGLGGIKEKTNQAKAEARRQGHEVSDESDDEIISSKKKSKEKGISGTAQARETAQKKAKDIYKTIHDMEAEGLKVPPGFKNIINMTQGGQGASISMENFQQGSTPTSDNEDAMDFQHALDKARQDINQYAKEWRSLQSRKSYAEFESEQIRKKTDLVVDELATLDGILSAFAAFQVSTTDQQLNLDSTTDVLEKVQYQYIKEVKSLQLDEVAVAALTEPLEREISTWDPLAEPTRFKETFVRLKLILDIHPEQPDDEFDEDLKPRPDYSYYESLIYHIWLPKVREALREKWKYTKPASAILIIESWSSILPQFILDDLLSTVVNTGLKPAIKHWKPASMRSHGQSPPPHTWLFPWLPYIRDYIPDVCESIKSRFGHLLRGWRVSDGAPLEGLLEWKEIFGETEMETLLAKNLLPRLSTVLKRDLDFSFEAASDSDKQSGFREIMKWHIAFKSSTFGELLETAVFTRWESATYKFLTGSKEPDLMKLTDWYEGWHNAFPVEVTEIPVVSSELHACLKLIEDAVDIPHRERAARLRKTPLMLGTTRHPGHTTSHHEKERKNTPGMATQGTPAPVVKPPVSLSTFREVVDEKCSELDLFLVPMRKAHTTLGFPLYRITPSATGQGPSVTCYFDDNVLWVSKGGTKQFEPVSLDDLAEIASF